MRIVRDKEPRVKLFKDLPVGAVYNHKDSGEHYYMKIEGREESHGFVRNALCLNDGTLRWTNDEASCLEYDAVLTLEG